MIFIHLAGMHYPVQEGIPECEKHFTDDVEGECIKDMSVRDRDRNNRYDDAILYEDKVLGGLVDILRKRKRPSCLMFISDHGESPRAMGWRDYHNRDVYEVRKLQWLYSGGLGQTATPCVLSAIPWFDTLSKMLLCSLVCNELAATTL